MQSRLVEEGLKVIVFSQMQFSVGPGKLSSKSFSRKPFFLERKPVE